MGINLGNFVSKDEDIIFANPFTLVDGSGNTWAASARSYWFVAQAGQGKYPRWSGPANYLGVMLRLLQSDSSGADDIEVAPLLSWLKKEVASRVDVLGVLVNVSYLEQLLTKLGWHRCSIWAMPEMSGLGGCLGLAYGDVRVALMGCLRDETNPPPTYTVPRSNTDIDWLAELSD